MERAISLSLTQQTRSACVTKISASTRKRTRGAGCVAGGVSGGTAGSFDCRLCGSTVPLSSPPMFDDRAVFLLQQIEARVYVGRWTSITAGHIERIRQKRVGDA